MPVYITIFEDNEKLRKSLVALLESSPDFVVLGNYGDCTKASEIIEQSAPDLVLMDIDLPGSSGIEGVKSVKETRPQTLVIMYTVFEDDEKLFKSLCAGATGYLLKKTPPERLLQAIREVIDGGAPMSPTIAKKVIQSFQQYNDTLRYDLSKREKEVLLCLTKGYSAKMIGKEINLSFETVRSHLKNIYQKLHVNCGKEAIVKALSERIV